MAAAITIRLGGRLNRSRQVFLNADSEARAKILKSWTQTYGNFIYQRFKRASAGDGTWPPLAPATLARRRARGNNSDAIHIDTGVLFKNLDPQFVTYYDTQIFRNRFEAIVGFTTKDVVYPDGTMLDDVMLFCQLGNPSQNRPPRKILVPPTKDVQDKMAKDGKEIVKRAING